MRPIMPSYLHDDYYLQTMAIGWFCHVNTFFTGEWDHPQLLNPNSQINNWCWKSENFPQFFSGFFPFFSAERLFPNFFSFFPPQTLFSSWKSYLRPSRVIIHGYEVFRNQKNFDSFFPFFRFSFFPMQNFASFQHKHEHFLLACFIKLVTK